MKKEHNESGHINIYTKDQDSHITGYGKHERVIAFIPDAEGLYCRIDLCWGLPIPSEKDVLKVARSNAGAMGRWKLKAWNFYQNSKGKHIQVLFIK